MQIAVEIGGVHEINKARRISQGVLIMLPNAIETVSLRKDSRFRRNYKKDVACRITPVREEQEAYFSGCVAELVMRLIL
ncbi:MAG: hypothetical protein J6X18_00460 [Bacteroidales bacterium]|nr:hypothetical protein [Bacteroidales bacterium]